MPISLKTRLFLSYAVDWYGFSPTVSAKPVSSAQGSKAGWRQPKQSREHAASTAVYCCPILLPLASMQVLQTMSFQHVWFFFNKLHLNRTILIVVALFAHFYLNRLQQFPEFDLTDTSIQYSIKEVQTVSNGLLVAVLVIPYLSIVAGNLLFNFRDWWDLHASLLGLSISYSASGSFVQFVRVTAGRPRPDFIARCDPAAGSVNSAFFGLTNITICQSTDSAFIKDGMRSFFSGHAILSAAGLGFMSLYWAGKLHLFNQKAYTYKVWLVFSPLILSIWICLTRVADRRHHWNDVALGFFLGLLFTYIIYRQFYPSLGDPECDIPFRPRVMSAEPEDTRGGSTGLRLPTRRPGWMRLGGSANRGPEGELESLGFMTTPFDSRHENGAENYPLNRRTSIPPTTS